MWDKETGKPIMHKELMLKGYLEDSKPCWLDMSLLSKFEKAQQVEHLAKELPKAV